MYQSRSFNLQIPAHYTEFVSWCALLRQHVVWLTAFVTTKGVQLLPCKGSGVDGVDHDTWRDSDQGRPVRCDTLSTETGSSVEIVEPGSLKTAVNERAQKWNATVGAANGLTLRKVIHGIDAVYWATSDVHGDVVVKFYGSQPDRTIYAHKVLSEVERVVPLLIHFDGGELGYVLVFPYVATLQDKSGSVWKGMPSDPENQERCFTALMDVCMCECVCECVCENVCVCVFV